MVVMTDLSERDHYSTCNTVINSDQIKPGILKPHHNGVTCKLPNESCSHQLQLLGELLTPHCYSEAAHGAAWRHLAR